MSGGKQYLYREKAREIFVSIQFYKFYFIKVD